MQFKVCTKCNEDHPLAHFKYRATYAQSKSWGRAGNVRMELESKLCRNCRPKRKPVSRLTKKEMHNKVQTGDMNAFIAKHEVAKRKQDAKNKQAIASRKRWEKLWKAELKQALAPITKEIVSARNAHLYAKEKGYVDKAEFYKEYTGMLKRAKDLAEFEHMRAPRRPPSSRWADYIEPEVITKIKELWAELPLTHKHTGKLPMLIKHRPE